MASSIKSNLWKLPTIVGLRWFMLVLPVLVLFYQSNGLSMRDILVLQAIFSVAIVVFEVPSGYFADKLGRKQAIVIGVVCGFAGWLAYSLSASFETFLVAEIIMALGSSFISGADSAMLYDTVAELDQNKEYKKHEGRLTSIGNFSEGLAAIAGGFLAAASLRYPVYFQAVLNLIAFPIALSLVEPVRQLKDKTEWASKGILDAVKFALHGHPKIKWLIIYSGVISAGTLTAVFFFQKYFENVALPIALFGIVWAVLQFSVGFFALSAHKIEGWLGRSNSLLILPPILTLAYFLLGTFEALWGILFILLFFFVRGFNTPILMDYVNQLAPSEIRATILSVKQLATRIIFAVTGPLAGWVHDAYSFQTAFYLSGALFLAFSVVSLVFLKKHEAL